ncbi:sphinganine hydroxylase-like protein Sur2 [Lindgomyces ingoldianus]|uniref:Sphinganine hydroxylase-like protein Sur2 n=1 Tax=Lindgomyces ingoldianus TaxID=673940 RepID=A0ACB6QJV4_9PLEO|nr:sphinganine hydroxylase-like protein Sur2 [Lindgomyces ingoldianus]KAF2466415.1 sphinganine hydroxylase-like protein Sur2 [Lindgomyces ingoldianus]
MATANISHELPPLPDYTLRPLPPLVSWLPDSYLVLLLIVVAYWVVSLIFHVFDVYDLFPQYRLHTPAEVLKRNHVTRWEVFRDVVIQQIIQTLFGFILALIDEEPMCGKEEYDVAWYAQKIRLAQRAIPPLLASIGLNSGALATKLSATQPMLAAALSGGNYPWLVKMATVAGQHTLAPAFAPWELRTARILYSFAIPALQFLFAMLVVDTWQYCLHRAMHQNKWLYATFHSRHHRLYVPYAYGALYNHPFEGFLLDTLGTGLAYLASGMTVRQSMWFFTCATVKTVDDHCGYSLPFDPMQLLTSNNAGYHDIHHQSWGIKTNFSQPFFTFWDRFLNTMWNGGDVTARYEKSRRHAQQKVDRENAGDMKELSADSLTQSSASELDESSRGQSVSVRRSTRKKSSSISQSTAGNWKGLRNKVNESLHGKGGNVLGVESSH